MISITNTNRSPSASMCLTVSVPGVAHRGRVKRQRPKSTKY